MTGMPPLTKRVPVRAIGPGVRLVLELDATDIPPVTRKFIRHIDRVRCLLAEGRVSPDEAHGLLIDCTWVLRP